MMNESILDVLPNLSEKNKKQPREKRIRRQVDGIFLLNKDAGATSNSALQEIKRLYNAKKAGHTGTLDPLATGVLPICLGEATKFSQFLLDADKGYLVRMQFGLTTTTGDGEGEIVRQQQSNVKAHDLLKLLPSFTGEIEQTPPMYSAVKIDGVPLYKLARAGKTIARPSRKVQIYSLDLVNFDESKQQADISISCSKGTYVRTLVEDLGDLLAVGASVIALQRTYVGSFELQQSKKVSDLVNLNHDQLDELLLPIDAGLISLPRVQIGENAAFYWLRGNPILASGAPKFGLVRVFNHNEVFIGVGEIDLSGLVAPKRVIQL